MSDYTQRDRILRALARGDGQMMDGFDLGQTAETMYGGQADQIEYLIAAEQRAALKDVARELEGVARLLRGEPGDRARRSEVSACVDRIRDFGQRITKAAQERFDERRAASLQPPLLIDYGDPNCICRIGGMGRRTDCPMHGDKAGREPCWCPAGRVLHAPGTPCSVRSYRLDIEDGEVVTPPADPPESNDPVFWLGSDR